MISKELKKTSAMLMKHFTYVIMQVNMEMSIDRWFNKELTMSLKI